MTIPPELKDSINDFARVFTGYVNRVDAVSLGDDDELYRKCLTLPS